MDLLLFIREKNKKGDPIISIFSEKNMGSILHENRHGGQHYRKELNIITGKGYGVNDEIDAYRAQYSWNGIFEFIDVNKIPTEEETINSLKDGYSPFKNTINSIHQITAELINSLVDDGFKPIYPPRDCNGNLLIPISDWNSN